MVINELLPKKSYLPDFSNYAFVCDVNTCKIFRCLYNDCNESEKYIAVCNSGIKTSDTLENIINVITV